MTTVSSQKQHTRSVSTAASYSQMTAVFDDVATSPKKFQLHAAPPPTLDSSETVTVVHVADDSTAGSGSGSSEISDMFAALNVAALHNLGGGDVLLEVCDSALVYLRRYRIIYEEDLTSTSGQEMKLPTSLSDVLSVRMRSANLQESLLLSLFMKFCKNFAFFGFVLVLNDIFLMHTRYSYDCRKWYLMGCLNFTI